MFIMKTQGERLRHVRESLNLSQSQLAGLLGVTGVTISRAETNATTLSVKTMRSLAEVTGVNPLWIEHGQGELGELNTVSLSANGRAADPWKEEAYTNLKAEVSRLEFELNRVWEMMYRITGGKAQSFHKGVKEAGALMYQFPGAGFSASLTPQAQA